MKGKYWTEGIWQPLMVAMMMVTMFIVAYSARLQQEDTREVGLAAVEVYAGMMAPMGHENLTVAAGATKALTVPTGANVALLYVVDGTIFYTSDSTTPSTTNGITVPAGTYITYSDFPLATFGARAESTNVEVNVNYGRRR